MNIIVAGDFCPQHRVAQLFGEGFFGSVLGEVKPVIDQADYAIANFECPVCNGKERPIIKCGPRLKCDKSGFEALKWAGFGCVTLANNHFFDYGSEGVKNTIIESKKHGIDVVGGGMSIEEAGKVLYKSIEGQTLAIINCCEHEFSIATSSTAGSNPLNPIQQFHVIKEAREKAEYILVIVHGGHEHFQLPSLRMQETYRFFVDVGADAVVNHHQHCYSGYEVYNGKPIFYGLGNFCFDKGKHVSDLWNNGYMVNILFEKDDIKFDIIPYSQCSKEPVVAILEKSEIQQSLDTLNSIISDHHLLTEEVNKYYSDSLGIVKLMLEPISNRYVRGLQIRHILPMFRFGKKYLLRLYDSLLCEAHKDRVSFFLEQEYLKNT